MTIAITGDNFTWHIRYPGADGLLGTADDVLTRRDLHLPVGSTAKLLLRSTDYIYTLSFPAFDLREIAVPDLDYSLTLQPDRAGTFQLTGDQFCGYSHPDLMGKLIVEPSAQFEKWLRRARAAGG